MKNLSSHNSALLALQRHHNKNAMPKNAKAFSLIEMLMALLVASLLMAALAPVMIKKSKEGVSLTGEVNAPKLKKHEILFDSENCTPIDTATNTCSGSFKVPTGVNGTMYITTVGGGGGGGAAASNGSIEYTSAGNYNFVVPAGVTELEVTLVSGGAGGGAGGEVSSIAEWIGKNTDTTQDNTWTVPAAVKNAYVNVTACGGGGGGGGAGGTNISQQLQGGGGGAGGLDSTTIRLNTPTSLYARIGGGGSGAVQDWLEASWSSTISGGGLCGGSGGYGYYSIFASTGGVETTWGGKAGILNTKANRANYNQYFGEGLIGGAAGGTGSYNGGSGGTFCGGGGGSGGIGWGPGGKYPGGGGGGGGATVLATDTAFGSTLFVVGGGGGGAGGSLGDFSPATLRNDGIQGGGGGGGGGTRLAGRGGNLTAWNDYFGRVGYSGNANARDNTVAMPGTTLAGLPSTWTDNCNGGNSSNNLATPTYSVAGKPGALRISYLDYGSGGSGGGTGEIVPKQKIKVTPGETLSITVGAGGAGGTAGLINASGTTIIGTTGANGAKSAIARGGTNILRTCFDNGSCGNYGGNPNGAVYTGSPYSGMAGAISNGTTTSGTWTSIFAEGFGQAGGKGANNSTTLNTAGAVKTSGGDGGQATLFGANYCTAGTRGTSVAGDMNGKNATGYGGCGGGGGYGLNPGGNGAPGYVRITWNPSRVGNGGGGGSGNTLSRKGIEVTSNSTIKYQIGGGGAGGNISTDLKSLTNGQNGSNTVFGTGAGAAAYGVMAGGGFGGFSSTVTGTLPTTIKTDNGKGGLGATACQSGSTCTDSSPGQDATNDRSGNGASTSFGAGATSVSSGNGQAAAPIGSGGSGGYTFLFTGILSNGASYLNSFSTGGKGAPGKILVEWYE